MQKDSNEQFGNPKSHNSLRFGPECFAGTDKTAPGLLYSIPVRVFASLNQLKHIDPLNDRKNGLSSYSDLIPFPRIHNLYIEHKLRLKLLYILKLGRCSKLVKLGPQASGLSNKLMMEVKGE